MSLAWIFCTLTISISGFTDQAIQANAGTATTCIKTSQQNAAAMPGVPGQSDLVISCPGVIVVSCTDDVPAPDASLVTVEESCGPVTITHVDDASFGACPESILRTYQATDSCGNTSMCEQVIAIDDQLPPVITCPADITIGCESDLPAPDVHSVAASDACGSVTITFIGDSSDGHSCPEVIRRTYRAVDDCGNTAECIQTITVSDEEAPLFHPPPADITVHCAADIPPQAALQWTDNCDGAGAVSGTDGSDGLSCPEIIVRSWSYTDMCGNSSTAQQTIVVFDNVAPVISCPDLTVNCPGDIPAPFTSRAQFLGAGGTLGDNCGIADVEFLGEGDIVYAFNGTGCPGRVPRWYRAIDNCGNTSTCTQYIIVHDKCDPEAVCPCPTSVVTASLCPGESIVINGQTYHTAGTYMDTLSEGGTNGCDSILIITIIELPPATSTIADSICAGTSVEIGGQVYDTPGVYVDSLFGGSIHGCDSISTITITSFPNSPPEISYVAVIAPDPGSGSGSVLLDSITTGAFAPYTFHWSNGDTGPAADNLFSGFHNVTVTNTIGCDTVLIFHVPLDIPIPPDLPPDRIPVFPNPFQSGVQLDLSHLAVDRARIVICDIYGRTVLEREIASSGPHKFSIDAPSGIYVAYVVEDGVVLGVERLVKVGG